jgi:biopolymer transport protein ExbD
MARRSQEEVGMNMTPMIDIVFQLIIFFIVTSTLDKQQFQERIKLAMSPHGPPIETTDPRTITIEVDDKGNYYIARNRLSFSLLTTVLKNASAQYGNSTPVHIRADLRTDHEYVRLVMEACGQAQIYKISFVATKEEAPERGS